MLVLLEGHNIKKDLEELLRLCFNTENIDYIDDIQKYNNKGILFYNKIYLENGIEKMESRVYIDGKIENKYKSNIEDIEVYINRKNKKYNVSIKKSIVKLTNSENKLPWGILTGIRPVKILHDLFDKKIDEFEIRKILKNEYLLWDEKIDILIEVAKRQRVYIEENKNKYSLYIGIPFCPTRCLYCSFPALPINSYEDIVTKYVETLIYEIDETLKIIDKKEINTVYIGGGTPTAIEEKELERIIKYINKKIGRENIREFTVEAGRPDTINDSYLNMLKSNHIDRISINPQTMNDKTLKVMGRDHSSQDIIDVYKKAEIIGFKSINMDLIIGLPGEGYDEVKHTLNMLEKLNPDNLTIHTLAVKRGSKFKNRIDEFEKTSNEEMNKITDLIKDYTKRNDLKPYYLYRQKQSVSNLENIGYGREDSICIYNISMMEERETIIGLGMGSVSKILKSNGSIERVPNFKGIDDYLDRIDELIERKNNSINE